MGLFKQVVKRAFALSGYALVRRSILEGAAAGATPQSLLDQLSRAATAPDRDFEQKSRERIGARDDFGASDFAELAWLFASSLSNHRVIHQRFDEAALLWRAAKQTAGPVLEVGRAGGGTTVCLLAATGSRHVVSVDLAPVHDALADCVFARADVRHRLTLHVQSSRVPIPERDFGFLFIDGDHSYEGVCSDIASFWNQLRAHEGRPALAAFHDAAENPIAFVPAVRRAVLELIAEPGVCRIVESAGSLLVVEKLSDVDPRAWRAKSDRSFWSRESGVSNAPRGFTAIVDAALREERVAQGSNLLEHALEHPSWTLRGFTCSRPGERAGWGADNRMLALRETPDTMAHELESWIANPGAILEITVFVRTAGRERLRAEIVSKRDETVAACEVELGAAPRIASRESQSGRELLGTQLSFETGFYRWHLLLRLAAEDTAVLLRIRTLDSQGAVHYAGDANAGLFLNSISAYRVELGATSAS